MTKRIELADSGIEVFPLCLGGNVFGWTADEATSFEVLDSYVEAGGNFVDTADGYSRWVPGHTGGESETIIGKWLAARGNREQMVISTKVFGHPEYQGLGGKNIIAACEASLRRLQTDYLDVYYAHHDDPEVPMEETLSAFSKLVDAGKVRVLGASNFSPERIDEAQQISRELGLHSYRVAQDRYNLVDRGYEVRLRPAIERHSMTQLPYYALASGFLTGKYRAEQRPVDTARGGAAGRWLSGHCNDYLTPTGLRVLDALDQIAEDHGCAPATVALAWLRAKATVGAPIASARAVHQLPALVDSAKLELSDTQIKQLDEASTVLVQS